MYNVAKFNISPAKQTYIALCLCVTSMMLYIYFLNVSVVHVVMRKEASLQSNQLRTEIAQLETTFIQAQHKIADRIADLDGYRVDTDKIFVTRGESSLVLRSN